MILVTGDAGFIGGHFKRTLESRGEQVLGLEKHEVKDFIDNKRSLEGIDLIIHNGAISSTTETSIEELHYYNVEMTLTLLELAALYEIPVKYASSAAIYGNALRDVNPLNLYAISKLQVDYWVQENLDRFPLIQGFRYFNVYGPGERHKRNQASPVSKFAWQAQETGVIELFEDSENIYRDFVWVGDIVKSVLDTRKGSGIYDLGTGEPVSFDYVARLVADKYNAQIKTIPFPEHLKGKYQHYTEAHDDWSLDVRHADGAPYYFKTIREYLYG